MTLSPYLFFNGNCREALTHYGQVFGTTPILMEPSEAPDFPVEDDKKHWIMHGMVPIAGGMLMASDDFMGSSPQMAGCAVSAGFETAEEARAVFDKLAEGGEVMMDFAATFWSEGFGMLTDRFGTTWMVGCDAPEDG